MSATPLSTAWVLGAYVLYLAIEVVLGGWLGGLLAGFVSWPFAMRLEVILMLASWWVGGLLVGLISPRVRLLEPGVAAFLAVATTMLYAVFVPHRFFAPSLGRLLLGGAVAFGLGVWGADTGERLAARLGVRASRDYVDGA